MIPLRFVRRAASVSVLAAAFTVALGAPAALGANPPQPTAPAGCAGADLEPSLSSLAAVRQATLCLLNAERTAWGLRPLRERSRLRKAATRYSQAMARANFFGHVSPRGQTLTDRILSTGYLPRHRPGVLGENLAWGTNRLARPRSIVQAWMDSPAHRRIILREHFRDVGVGIAAGSPDAGVDDSTAATYTAHFGAVL